MTLTEKQLKTKSKNLKQRYGITLEEHDAMLVEQDNKCGICRCNFKKICVDHFHKTGTVRGLLCDPCNTGLGKFHDSLDKVKGAYKYLLKHYEKTGEK